MSDKKSLEELRKTPTFCTLAWTGVSISPSGAITPCCLYEESIKDDNKQSVRIYQDDIDDYFNGEFLQSIRKKMLNGEEVEGCRQCYDNEKYGGISLRRRSNYDEWDSKEYYDLEGKDVPISLDLKLNNKCNLKCRMCQPRDSHLIYNEFTEILKENKEFKYFQNTKTNDPELNVDLSKVPDWNSDPTFKAQIKKMLPNIRKLSLVGGEPLILDSLYELLDLIIAEGHADHIYLAITTNLMTLKRERIKDYFDHFERVLILISLDAVGRELNYIRYPSDFNKIERNFRELYDHPKTNKTVWFSFAITSQLYNALYIVDILKFLDALMKEGFRFPDPAISFTYLSFPRHLNIRALPDKLREKAIKDLKEFEAQSKALKGNVFLYQGFKQLIGTLRQEVDPDREKLLEEFLFYSDVLDKKRNQSLAEALPDLYHGIIETGAIARKPEPDYHMIREEGWELAGSGKLKEASERFEKAILSSKDKNIDLRELGWIYMDLGEHKKSLNCYERAFKLDPNDKYIARGYVIAAHLRKKKKIVAEVIPQALRLYPEDEELLKIKDHYNL